MRPLDDLPSPETIAKKLASTRKERQLLRKLYQLTIDLRNLRRDNSAGEEGLPPQVDDKEVTR